MAPICVLVGPPGAGKTTTGQALAGLLGLRFLDTDTVVEQAAGKPIPEIFIDDGEAHFRALERAAVADALASFDGVLALGGGAILADGTRTALAGHTVVFLSVELPDAVKRVGLGAGRPLLAVNPRATLKYLMEQRRPLYETVAAHTIKTDGRTPDDVADEVAALLRG
jgi:shikimate kinase